MSAYRSSPARGSASGRERLYYLDWIRVGAILCVFLIHCGKIFDVQTSVMFNDVRSAGLSAVRDSLLLWIMPLFFVLSGAATRLSGAAERPGAFIGSRFLRLFIPLIFVGTFAVNPVYVYIERLFDGQTTQGFFAWYPTYFRGIYGFGGNFAPLGQGTHLWYLEFLFVYSLILLPLFARSKKRGSSLLARLGTRFANPWAVLCLFIPVSAAAATFELAGLSGIRVIGGWDPISYLFFLAYGYMMFSNQKTLDTVRKMAPMALGLAAVLTALLIDTHFGFVLSVPGLTRHDLSNAGAPMPGNRSWMVTVQALRGLASWCWILAVLGLGQRLWNRNSRALAYANQAVLPFYILHHAVIYVVGYYVIQMNVGVASKFTLIALGSCAIILALYELVIRRIPVLRFLFGQKWRVQ